MARATTKQELLKAASAQYDKMWAQINSLSDEVRFGTFCFEDRDKNIRDILIHLYEWHQLLLNWVKSNQAGNEQPFLPKPYNWKTYPDMNVGFWEKHQSTSYDDAKKMLESSHSSAVALIDSFSDDELFIKKHFSWTGTTSLGSYCVSATSSHYDWAINKIKNHIKTYGK